MQLWAVWRHRGGAAKGGSARSNGALVAWLAARGHNCGAGPAETVAAETSEHYGMLRL